MARLETIKFEISQYQRAPRVFESDVVAQLPGLLITQFEVPDAEHLGQEADKVALKFDFIDDWYCVVAFLDGNKRPTGHYRISIQTPLRNEGGAWKGCDLILGLEVGPNWDYVVIGEEDFCAAVEEGWMRVYAAANAREALRRLCLMLGGHSLPQEVMDAVRG